MELIADYPDIDSAIASMIILFANKEFKNCLELGAAVLQSEDLNEYQTYLVLYFLIFCQYYIADKKPNSVVINWMKEAADWCINIASMVGNEESTKTVSDSLNELISEIEK